MKQVATLLLAFTLGSTVSAQNGRDDFERARQQMLQQYNQTTGQMRQDYDEQRQRAEAEYTAFRKKANEEYASFLRKAWESMSVQPAEPQPKEPEPPKPQPKPVPDRLPQTKPLPKPDVVAKPEIVVAPPMPALPQAPPEIPTEQFSLYGTDCQIHVKTDAVAFKLSSVAEKSVAESWELLSRSEYDGLLHDCLEQRDALKLGDWGYLDLLKSVSERMLGQGTNEAVLMQMYLFVQSGYKARIGKQDGRLVLLVPFKHTIYSYSYVMIDGMQYYVLSKNRQGGVEVCNVGFPKEQLASIVMSEQPKLKYTPAKKRTFESRQFGTMNVEVAENKNLIDFLNGYPLSSEWSGYARAGLSKELKEAIYPTLREQIAGKSQKKAALMLLNFVQTAFDYATDQDQFGYERPLFGDESFYYPKNDCEDRAILYSILVRDLIGLDVVLVLYPGHLGTAVHFTDNVEGSYYDVDGKHYVVCDPTYIGAGVGEVMPQFENTKVTIVKID